MVTLRQARVLHALIRGDNDAPGVANALRHLFSVNETLSNIASVFSSLVELGLVRGTGGMLLNLSRNQRNPSHRYEIVDFMVARAAVKAAIPGITYSDDTNVRYCDANAD